MQITGTVIAKIFEGDNGYTVAEIAGAEPALVVGSMPNLRVGELTRFTGEYTHHQKYGKQFAVESYDNSPPVDREDMVLFLSSDFVKGIGEVLAQRLVDQFGERTFEVIENEPERIACVRGISAKVANDLHEAFKAYDRAKYRYTELMGMGLTAKQAEKAEEALGNDAVNRIQQDPYVLIDAVRGIDFLTADHLARGIGIDANSPLRVQNGVLHVLRKSLALGNLYVKKDALIPHIADKLQVEPSLAEEAICTLTLLGRIHERTYGAVDCLFLSSSYRTELRCAQMLMDLKYSPAKKDASTSWSPQSVQKYRLTPEQTDALETVLDHNVSVITGGPGTGKTTILRALLHVFHSCGMKCLLAAPTGRAAKRMQEATGVEAKTLHRLLEYAYDEEEGEGFFRVNEDNPLKGDVVLVDEMSMVDIFLFHSLLRGVAPGTRLVLIGDADQLPSVGPGNVLRDLIYSQTVPTEALTYHFRNAGLIADGAHALLAGEMPEFDADQFVFLEASSPDAAQQIIVDEYRKLMDAGMDVQVIAPIKKTPLGSIALNDSLRDAVNPPAESKPQIVRGEKIYRVGDRVMQTSNDYERSWDNPDEGCSGEGVFNGDIGTIESIRGTDVRVRFDDGRICCYTAEELFSLDGAFAYTIHKSQGNEFDAIILPMLYPTGGARNFLSRSLLYTGVTRAREKVIIVGSPYTFAVMAGNDVRSARATGLTAELQFLDAYYSNGFYIQQQ